MDWDMPLVRLRSKDGALEAPSMDAIVAALRAGALAALPTETVYGIAARADDPRAIERLRAAKGERGDAPFAFHIGHEDLDALPVRWSAPARRLATRYWPGPVMLLLPAKDDPTHIGWRSPAVELTRAILRAADCPIVMTSANRSGAKPINEAEAIAQEFGDELAFVVDSGPPPIGEASTIVKLGNGPMRVLREGILRADEVRHLTGRRYVFICTGNTCRSPMAEAWMRRRIATHLGCSDSEVGSYGYAIHSMGVAASPGERASAHAVTVLGAAGIDLGTHRSSRLDRERLLAAHEILTMGPHHLDYLLKSLPELRSRARLITPDSVPDPIGGPLEDYQRCSDVLRAAVETLEL